MELLTPFFLQGLAMMVDEFHFHKKRGLPLWERLGHPLDTLTVFVCLLLPSTLSPSPSHLKTYFALSAFSCLFVTKDEFVHGEICTAGENWLHAILFLLHPISLIAAAMLWKSGERIHFLQIQTALIGAFMLYQITYWNFLWKSKSTPKLTTI